MNALSRARARRNRQMGYPTGACTSLGSGFVSRLAASDAGAGGELLDMHMKSAGAAGGFDLRHAH